jgi:hypothetical protein
MSFIILPATLISVLIGIIFIFVPYVKNLITHNFPYAINGEDPGSNINKLTNDGKNMVYAGLGLLLIPLFILLSVIFGFHRWVGTLKN